jgi:hypothetical protein
MQTSTIYQMIPHFQMGKKHDDDVDKGTTRKTPGNNEGARPPKEEDFDKVHEKNQKNKKNSQA